MPVQETLDGIDDLREIGRGGIQPGGIIVNMVRPNWPLTRTHDERDQDERLDQRDQDALAVALKAAGLGDDHELAADLADELADEARMAQAQRDHRRRLDVTGQPCYELPLISDEIDLAALYRLAEALREQGAA